MSVVTGMFVILKPPSGRSTGRAEVRAFVVFRLMETTSNVGPAGVGGAAVCVKTWDVNAAISSGDTANLASGFEFKECQPAARKHPPGGPLPHRSIVLDLRTRR